MVITSSHVHFYNSCKGCDHCFETSKKVSGVSHAVKVTVAQLAKAFCSFKAWEANVLLGNLCDEW